MEELSLPDMIAAHRLMQLSGRQEEGEDLSNLPLKNIIKLVCNDMFEENRVNLSSKRKVEEIECKTPLINATKRKRYRSLDSIYKKTRPIGGVCKGGTTVPAVS
ncbi:hypothetical protein FCM35_KLT03404 [Carex littledalei]|uniref:Uncharacterized protein n=1 Tax=Carex littledalei TaxID=544730 RepID=A0A833R202_9POAL|nr:hypothetical protein FCM35_KLT03404 [Carex littledalei]